MGVGELLLVNALQGVLQMAGCAKEDGAVDAHYFELRAVR